MKSDAFLAEQDPKALVADVVERPLGYQEVGQLGWTPGRERQAVLAGLDLAIFVISRPVPANRVWSMEDSTEARRVRRTRQKHIPLGHKG